MYVCIYVLVVCEKCASKMCVMCKFVIIYNIYVYEDIDEDIDLHANNKRNVQRGPLPPRSVSMCLHAPKLPRTRAGVKLHMSAARTYMPCMSATKTAGAMNSRTCGWADVNTHACIHALYVL